VIVLIVIIAVFLVAAAIAGFLEFRHRARPDERAKALETLGRMSYQAPRAGTGAMAPSASTGGDQSAGQAPAPEPDVRLAVPAGYLAQGALLAASLPRATGARLETTGNAGPDYGPGPPAAGAQPALPPGRSAAPSTSRAPGAPPSGPGPAGTPSVGRARQSGKTPRRRSRSLARAVQLLIVVDVLAAVVLGLSLAHIGGNILPERAALSNGPSSASPSAPTNSSGVASSRRAGTARGTSHRPASQHGTASPPTTGVTSQSLPQFQGAGGDTASAALAGGASPGPVPVLAAISPAAGVGGQVVTLSGTGLFSANGVITVSFGSTLAPVRCPTETTCRVTVPPRKPASGSVAVRVTTQSGTSNQLSFSYG
jgi:IPT/TIG domain